MHAGTQIWSGWYRHDVYLGNTSKQLTLRTQIKVQALCCGFVIKIIIGS